MLTLEDMLVLLSEEKASLGLCFPDTSFCSLNKGLLSPNHS